MEWNCQTEFAVVDSILQSQSKTRGVDAVALAIIKAERQARRLFTFLVFQSPHFDSGDVRDLRSALARDRSFKFESAIAGFNLLAPVPVAELIGSDYPNLLHQLKVAKAVRNKVFHGQVTLVGLDRSQLIDLSCSIKQWCAVLASTAQSNIGYDGFGDNSYRKHTDPKFWEKLSRHYSIATLADYIELINAANRSGNTLFKTIK